MGYDIDWCRLAAAIPDDFELRDCKTAFAAYLWYRAGQSRFGAIVQNLPPQKTTKGGSLSGGQFVLLGALVAILIITIVWATTVWTSSNNIPMSKHGWIALGLGTFFSLVIGCGLMALMFFSSRSGHDEAATPKFVQRREPKRDDE
jgi:hypothetical protein